MMEPGPFNTSAMEGDVVAEQLQAIHRAHLVLLYIATNAVCSAAVLLC